jgi:hypothetical protein
VRPLALLALLVGPAFAQAAEPPADLPTIAIIVDDLGNLGAEGRRATDLPGPVAIAVLPGTPHAKSLAERAHANGKEVLLHLPLASIEDKALGPGGIGLDVTRRELERILGEDLAGVPHVVGVNNHMGSLITRHPGHMNWLMRALAARGLFFVDSYTTERSVALAIADEIAVPATRRDVFLDDDPRETAVRDEFERLLGVASRNGAALAIGHPNTATLTVLEQELARLAARGFRLVPVRALIERRRRTTS